ncbi:hypothetical protein [Ciceribacter azotifigens]|uniref:hypothetical protein n=1 Tax=Ciceribacter azotifigens TaxID=2069303 RepID=UPI003A860EA3
MTDRNDLVEFLKAQLAAIDLEERSYRFLGGRFFEMVIRGEAKLPLDRVEEVADLLGCDRRKLFRLAMRQFYDEDAIGLFERMFCGSVSDEEQKWLDAIRSAADGLVPEPNRTAKRLLRALVKPQILAEPPGL